MSHDPRSPPDASPAQPESVKVGAATWDEKHDLIVAAYEAGARAVHDNHQPDNAPDFTEAASDYAASVLPAPPVITTGGE